MQLIQLHPIPCDLRKAVIFPVKITTVYPAGYFVVIVTSCFIIPFFSAENSCVLASLSFLFPSDFSNRYIHITRLVTANLRAVEKPHLCGVSAYSNNSLQAPCTSVSNTCGYSSPICSLCETVRISPRTVAAAREVPRFGTRSYFSKS